MDSPRIGYSNTMLEGNVFEEDDVAISKDDSKNFSVVKYSRNRKGELVWTTVGYYGHHLEAAARFAVLAGCKDGILTSESFKEACASICACTRALHDKNVAIQDSNNT